MQVTKRSLGYRIKRDWALHWQAFLMIIPAIGLTILFSYVPMYGIILAFKKYKPILGIWGSKWVGFDHFVKFFSTPYFWQLLRNTVVFSLYSSAVSYPLEIILALLINEIRHLRFKKVVQTISYMPYFISTVVICGMLKSFLGTDGLFNAIGTFLGMRSQNYLNNPAAFKHIIVWADTWQGLGWGTIIYLSALSGIDQQLYEAAEIDGCGRLRKAWHVTLPGILPTIVILIILNFNLLSGGSDKIILLYSPLTYETGDVFSSYTYRIGIQGGQYDYTTAIGLCGTVVAFLTTVFVNWLSRKLTDTSLW